MKREDRLPCLLIGAGGLALSVGAGLLCLPAGILTAGTLLMLTGVVMIFGKGGGQDG